MRLTPRAVLTKSTAGKLIEGSDYPTAWSALVLVWMVTYVASYAIGLGNIPWLQGELFRLEVRGIGTSLCTATNWSMNLVIGATFLSLMDAITPAGAFGFYAGLCLLGWLFCVFFYPETCVISNAYLVCSTDDEPPLASQQLRPQP